MAKVWNPPKNRPNIVNIKETQGRNLHKSTKTYIFYIKLAGSPPQGTLPYIKRT